MFTNFDNFINEWNTGHDDSNDSNARKYYKGEPFNKSFAYNLNRFRESWKKVFGTNWEKEVDKETMKRVINNVLTYPSSRLHMSFREKKWWKYKIEYESKTHYSVFRIFYDAELSLMGLSVKKPKRDYR